MQDGVLRIKFSTSAVSAVETSTGVEGIAVQRSANGVPQTGLASVDQISQQYGTARMTRVYRPAGKYEPRHRAAGLHQWYRVEFEPSAQAYSGAALQNAIAAYQSNPSVSIAEPVLKKRFSDGYEPGTPARLATPTTRPAAAHAGRTAVTNDPLYGSQWHYNNTGQNPPGGTPDADIDLPEAQNIETGNSDVIVAIHDGGLDVDHEDLAANMWVNEQEIPDNDVDDDENGYVDDVYGYNFADDQGAIVADEHGTHVGGTVSAVTNNSTGVAGVAGGDGSPDSGVRLMSMQIFGADGGSGGAAESYAYAADNGAVISQNSWGYRNSDVFEQAVLDAIDYYIANAGSAPEAAMQGGLVLFAAGNDGTDDEWYPGYYEPTVAVAATGIDDHKSSYSNFGAWVDLAAPGGNGLPFDENDVLSTVPDDNYGYLGGTSMACPHASGVAGLIVSAGLGVTNDQVREILQSTTDDIDGVNPDFAGQLGTGRINAFSALQAFDPDDAAAPGAIADLAASLQNSINVELTWTAVADDAGDDASGPVFNYQIRYSTDGPISTPADFDAATPAARAPAPGEPGTEQSALVTGLDFDTQYWFAVRAIDDNRNTTLSNTSSVTTEQAPVLAYEPNMLTAEIEELGDSAVLPLTLSNEGPPSTTLAFSFPAFAAEDVVQATPESQRNDTSRPLEDASYTGKAKDPYSGAGHPVRLGAGGPDAFGYEWIDSTEPGGPAFNFTDISEAGTELALTDESIATVPLPFGFSFYGEEQTQVTISANGFLAFNDTDAAFSNAPIPDAAPPNGLIAPFWDDLDPSAGTGTVYYYDDADNNRFIVQFSDVQAFDSDSSQTYTFQAILNEDGTLLFQYADVESGGDLQSATVGIENYDGSDGLQVAFNTSYVEDGLAVALAAPPEFLADVEPASGILGGGSSQEVSVTFSSADIDEPGLYENELALQTSDPTNPVVAIPALLDAATGPPQIAVRPEAVDFGEVLAGGTARDSVFIVNDGGGILEVTALTVEGDNFDAGVLPPAPTPIFIPTGDSVNVNVSFTPPDLGVETATLTIESGDEDTPTVTVPLEGEGVPAPVADVSPDSLSETIEIGQTATDVLTLVNSGGGTLNFETLFQLTPDDSLTRADVAAPAPRSRPANEETISLLKAARPSTSAPRSSAQPLDAMDATYQLDDGTAENAIGVAQGNLDLMWLNAFEVVEGAGTITSVSTAWGFPDAAEGNPPAGTEAIALVYEDPDDDGDPTNAVLLSQSPITVQNPGTDAFTTAAIEATNVEGVFFVALLYPDQAPNTFPAPLDESSAYQEASWAAFDVNAEFDLEDLSNNSNPPSLIGDAGLEGNWLLRADAGPGVEIATVSPDSGSVAPGASQDLTVTYDATELVETAVYEGEMLITSNDPVNPVLAVPTTVDVDFGDPSIAVDPEAIDFGGVFVGGTQTASVTVVNDGAGPLDLTDLSTDADAFEATLDSTITVPIGDSTLVSVTFAPDAVQTYTGTLTLENNASDVEISLSGEGLPAPVLAVTPDSLSEALQVGETSTDRLTLSNEGGGTLTFQAMFNTSAAEGLTPSDVAAPASAGAGAAGLARAAAAATAPYEGPTTSATQLDVTYQLDDGTSENALGLGGLGDTYDMMWLNAFEAVEGASTITSISTTWGAAGSAAAPPAGQTGLALVYEDPDDDGDPTNAVLLSQSPITVQNPGTNTFTTVSIEPTEVEGAFFVAVLLEENAPSTFIAPLDESSEYQEASWFAGTSTGEDFNIEDLSANSTPPTEFGSVGFPGNLLLRAEGSEVNFVTVSPDSGSVAPGASQDLTVTYDATELDPGVYEGDVVITSNDPLSQSVAVPVTLQVLPTLTVTPEPGPDSTRSVSAGEEFLVPITVTDVDGLQVQSYEFTLTFAEALFAPVGVLADGTLSEGVALAVNTEVPGQIRVAAADGSGPTSQGDASQGDASQNAPVLFDIEGEGTLLFVRLRATQAVGASSELSFSSFLFNEGDPSVVTQSTTYRIGALLGDASGDGEVTALDASQVLRYAVGLIDFSGVQLAAADVSGDGEVGAFDASLILEFVGGAIDCFPADDGCAVENAPALAAQSSGAAQGAALAWGPPEQARPSGIQTSSASAGQPLFSVPLVLSGQGGVRSVELSADLDPSQVSVEGVEANLPEDWLVAHRFAEDGTLKIAMAGRAPLSAGQIATVKLRRLSSVKSAARQPPLELAGQMRFNEAALVQMQAAELVALPEVFAVKGNYPNPFSGRTQIAVDLPESAKVSVRVYDVLGRRVMQVTRELAAGAGRTVTLDGARLASGTYFYRVVAESSSEQRTGAGRMVLVK